MDFNEIITFEGGINTDDTPQGVPKGDYRDFSYCRLGYNSGNAFAVETSSGTIEINNPSILEEDKVLGATQWLKENAIVYFVYKDSGVHEIWVYYIATQSYQAVVQDAVLNFSPDWPIYHANVIDDILKWTDGRWDNQMYESDGTRLFNPPYQINIRKALDGFYTIYDLQVIDAVKWPMEPPIVSYFTDTTRNDNKLRGKLFKFIIQPIYENGEIGVWSMYSNLALPDQSELVSGTNWVFLNNDNVIKIQFDTGPKVVRGFNLAVQQYDRDTFGAVPPFGIFLQLNKDQDSINDNTFHTVSFYGDVATNVATDVFKNYDRLPITSDCQEYLPTNQLTYTNFREGYDKPTEAPFILDVTTGYDVKEVLWNSLDFGNLFDAQISNEFNEFILTYSGNPYGDVNNTFIFQVGDILQFVTWTDTTYPNNPYNNQRLFYSVSQEDVDTALALPTFFDKNAYIMKLVAESFIQQWGAQGYFDLPGYTIAYSSYGIRYVAERREGFNGAIKTGDNQGNYKIIGGDFTAVANVESNRICRIGTSSGLYSNGTVDPNFDVGTGFNNTVLAIKVQASNYIVVGGKFTEFNGVSRNRIALLGPDGWLDTTFNPGTGFNGDVYAIKMQADGKILVGGDFTEFNGVSRNLIARLNPDGTLDTSFTSPVTSVTPPSSKVYAIDIQSTGKIIIGGYVLGIPSAVSSNLARLNTDGTYDSTYSGNPNSAVFSISIATDVSNVDKAYIGGSFTTCNGSSSSKIARLNADGSLATSSITTGFDDAVYSVNLSGNYVYVCGRFTEYNGVSREKFIRLDFGLGFNADAANPFVGGDPVYTITDGIFTWILGDFMYTGTVGVSPTLITSNRMAKWDNFPFEYEGGGGFQSISGNLPHRLNWNVKDLDYDKVTGVTPSLKVGATHEFGIVYGDRAYRDSTVYTMDSMNLFVPWFYDVSERLSFTDPQNPFVITPKIAINHIPPVWATKYWIVAKPATEILSFGQYVTNKNNGTGSYEASIVLDSSNSRYKIYIDNYYVTNNKGANIRHEIKIGDKLRFKRSNWYYLDYLPYIELDIVEVGSESGRTIVYTNLFQPDIISLGDDFTASTNKLFGQEIEIYTPRPSVDDTGNVFVSTWKDITEAIQIIDPHTEDRAHGSPIQYYVQYSPNVFGGAYFYISGDQSQLLGTIWPITIHNVDGSVEQGFTLVQGATYDSLENATRLDLDSVSASPTIAYITFNAQDQIVNNLVSTTAAFYSINYGDVYLRQRNNYSGVGGDRAVLYWYIEDFNYSDYFPSNIHNDGRLRIEDQNAKMVHRKASSIHSDSFILGTQINGLSSFGLDNQNIEDMNPLYGEVVRTYMSGREGKTLKCLQPKRENSIYIQYYPNEVGSDSTVRVSNRTFASWFDYKSLFGCSDAGATAILPNGSVMYFDNNSGTFIYSGGNGQIVVSEIDPDTEKDYKFRTRTKALAKAYNESANPMVRTYVNETVGEVGFAFTFDNEETYQHVVFDYVNMRWRSTYDYNFRQFCNLGQALVGWGKNNQLYVHNQDGVWTFHGDSFIQKVSFVSNEQPLLLKRYQDIILISDDLFAIEASSEPNKSYPLGMKTLMSENLIGTFEGYGRTNYRKNLYDARFFVVGNVSETSSTTWDLDGNQTSLNGEIITIIQDDKNIYTGEITSPVYNSGPNTTTIQLVGLSPGTTGIAGTWYLSEKVLLNGEDVRANALTHTLSYDPAAPGASGEGSVLFSVGIKGVLS